MVVLLSVIPGVFRGGMKAFSPPFYQPGEPIAREKV